MASKLWLKYSPIIPAVIMNTLIMKNLTGENHARINVPEKHPMVRRKKYRLITYPASESEIPALSCRSLGAVILTPTSIPT